MTTIDLHNHVVPPTVLDAIRKSPERFHTSVYEKDGKTYFDVHGNPAELKPEFFNADAKVAWMDSVGMDIAGISVGPPIYFYNLSPDAGLEAAKLANDGIAQMVVKSAVRTAGSAIGREIVRGVLGSLLGGSRRKR